MEHTGVTIEELSMDSRLTLTNMAIEAGAKSGIVPPDSRTLAYVAERQREMNRPNDFEIYASDPDAVYERVIDIDVDAIEPMVARPSLPSRAVPVSQIAPVKVDQVFIRPDVLQDLKTGIVSIGVDTDQAASWTEAPGQRRDDL